MPNLRQYETWAKTDAHKRRVERAQNTLRRAAERGRLVVSSSWGKDSVALCDVAIETLGRVDIVHLSSPVARRPDGAFVTTALPGTERIADHFKARATVYDVPAPDDLEEWIAWLQEIGLEHERSGSSQGTGKRKKAGLGFGWVEAHGYQVQVLGLRAEEAKHRRELLRRKGTLYRLKSGISMAHPLAWWTSQDVWARIASRKLPYHPLYDCETHGMTRERIRNSGWDTTIGAGEGRIAWLRLHYPEQYRMLADSFPQVRMLG